MTQSSVVCMLGMFEDSGDSDKSLSEAIGKRIAELSLIDDVLYFEFHDGSRIKIFDDGQSCCELRYMHTDDNLSDYLGARLIGVEIKKGPTMEDDWGGAHEVQFLEVQTSSGSFTLASHNEHNGYYGGFWIRVTSD